MTDGWLYEIKWFYGWRQVDQYMDDKTRHGEYIGTLQNALPDYRVRWK